MSGAPNFLEPEEYEAETPNYTASTPPAAATKSDEPKFGEPGYNKGKPNKRKGTPRATITATDGAFLAFAGLFPGADEEAFSVLLYRQDSPMGAGGQLPSMSAIKSRLAKLRKMGVLAYVRHPMTGVNSYSLTKEGFEIARSFGYAMDPGRTLNGITMERLTHFRLIAHVAAQLLSPVGFFAENLGVNPVSLDQLANENEMRTAFQPFREAMKAQKKAGQNANYEVLRHEVAEEAFQEAQQGNLDWTQVINAYPTLMTLGLAGTGGKAVHQPDLAVKLDAAERTDRQGRNLMVEVELTPKSKAAYEQILATIKAELDSGIAYNQVAYFTVGTAVEKLLATIDRERGYGLFQSRQLAVLPLRHKDGSNLELANRIKLF